MNGWTEAWRVCSLVGASTCLTATAFVRSHEHFAQVCNILYFYADCARSRSYDFFAFATDDSAARAVNELHETELGGRRLRVHFQQPGHEFFHDRRRERRLCNPMWSLHRGRLHHILRRLPRKMTVGSWNAPLPWHAK